MSQTSAGESIVSEITIEASPERIFDALVNPQERIAWWGGGNAMFPAVASAIGGVITLAVSPLLIFGVGPLPGFGIAGAARAGRKSPPS